MLKNKLLYILSFRWFEWECDKFSEKDFKKSLLNFYDDQNLFLLKFVKVTNRRIQIQLYLIYYLRMQNTIIKKRVNW